jgi:hypothetical protein
MGAIRATAGSGIMGFGIVSMHQLAWLGATNLDSSRRMPIGAY